MMDQGILMAVVGSVMMAARPASQLVAGRPLVGTAAAGVILRIIHPVPLHPLPPARLVAEADEAMERDAMLRGVRGVTLVYDQA